MALFQLILKRYTILEGFFLLDFFLFIATMSWDIKVWLVQSQDLNVRLISQIDIVMCFICNISAMSCRYRGWCHSSIVTISECPLGYGSGIIYFPLNILEKLHWQHFYQRLIGFILVNSVQYPRTLKNNINHWNKRVPPPLFHSIPILCLTTFWSILLTKIIFRL